MTDGARATDRLDVRERLTALAPIAAMRSTRADTLDEALDGIAVASVEWRLGGPPIQVHRDDGDVVIFDRAGVDVTEQLDSVVDVVRALPGGDVVLDGNVVRFDADGSPIDASDVSLDELGDGGADLGACFVDLLAAEGRLVDAPLATRLQLLDELVPPANLIPRAEVGDVAEAQRFFDEAVRLGHPGIVVKDLMSPYLPGRRSRSWRHVVPVHVLKLLVIGAQRGTGRRAGRFSTLLLGAPTADGDVVMVGTSSSALTGEMLDWQNSRFRELALDDQDAGSDVLELRPEQVVEVAVDEVVESTRFPSGVTLQTAKVRRYLTAPADDVDSVESIRALVGAPWRSLPEVPSLPARSRGTATARPAETAPMADADRSSPTGEGVAGPNRPVLRLPAWVVSRSSASAAPRTSPLLPPSLQEQVTSRRAPVTDVDFDFAPFAAPKLLSLRFASVLVMVTRLAAVAWIVLLGRTALDADPTSVGGAPVDEVRTVGAYGIAVVVAVCVVGWWWSDRRTRNVHRLDGRRPGRFRCLTAWSAPIVLPALVGLTVLQLGPSEPFDVRPLIAIAVLTFAISRPISLIRRILASLIRVRFDGLLGVSFVLDVAAVGLIAWRLAVWPDPGDAVSAAEIDTLVVVCAATFVVLLLGLVDWALILRTAASAEAHRATSQRTRYEHRMLRLRNVDPTDPAVWWALVSRRASEQRELEASERGADRQDPPLVVPSADDFVEQARRRHRRALTRLGPNRAEVLLDQLRTEFLSVTEEVRAAAADALGDIRPPTAGAVRGQPADEPLSTEPLSTFRWRLGTTWEETEPAPAGALEQLLEHAGSIHIEAALAERRRDDEETGRERTVPPKLYALESARALLLVALIATAAAAVWLVSLTVGASLLADNETLSAEGLARIERARLAIGQAFSVTLVGATLWSWAIAVHARRCRPPSNPTRRTLLCFLVASAACAAMFLVDGADEGATALIVLLPATICAVVSVVSLEPIARWFRLRTGPLVMWAAGLPMILVLERISRLHDDIDRQVTLQSQTFLAILIGLTCALVCVVAASSTMELEDGVRLSPELAVPADRSSRSGGGPRRRERVPARR